MDTFNFDNLVEALRLQCNGRKKIGQLLFPSGRKANWNISGHIAGLRIQLELSESEVFADIRGFDAPCIFEFRVGASARIRRFGMSLAGRDFGCPFPIWLNPIEAQRTCIAKLFSSIWKDWNRLAMSILDQGAELLVCSHQLTILYPDVTGGDFLGCLREIAVLVSRRPFFFKKSRTTVTRYAEDLQIDLTNVPANLQPLVPLAIEWSITDEQEIKRYAAHVGRKRTEVFVASFQAEWRLLNEFCHYGRPGPVPPEVILFQIAGHAFAILS